MKYNFLGGGNDNVKKNNASQTWLNQTIEQLTVVMQHEKAQWVSERTLDSAILNGQKVIQKKLYVYTGHAFKQVHQ